jgi:hypothetical protein
MQVVLPRPSLASWPLGIIGRHQKKICAEGAHANHFDLLTLHTKKLQTMGPIILISFLSKTSSQPFAHIPDSKHPGWSFSTKGSKQGQILCIYRSRLARLSAMNGPNTLTDITHMKAMSSGEQGKGNMRSPG